MRVAVALRVPFGPNSTDQRNNEKHTKDNCHGNHV